MDDRDCALSWIRSTLYFAWWDQDSTCWPQRTPVGRGGQQKKYRTCIILNKLRTFVIVIFPEVLKRVNPDSVESLWIDRRERRRYL